MTRKVEHSQCDQIWQNFTTFAKIKKPWEILGRIIWYSGNFEPVLPTSYGLLDKF